MKWNICILDVLNADEERECLSNPAGRGYSGSVNVTVSGKPCLPWIDVPTELCYNLPDRSTADALNYCRYIPEQQWIGTSCAVRTKTGVQLERCSVPYCGGENRFNYWFGGCIRVWLWGQSIIIGSLYLCRYPRRPWAIKHPYFFHWLPDNFIWQS